MKNKEKASIMKKLMNCYLENVPRPDDLIYDTFEQYHDECILLYKEGLLNEESFEILGSHLEYKAWGKIPISYEGEIFLEKMNEHWYLKIKDRGSFQMIRDIAAFVAFGLSVVLMIIQIRF